MEPIRLDGRNESQILQNGHFLQATVHGVVSQKTAIFNKFIVSVTLIFVVA
jgi:hypothetical protein